MLSVSVFGWTNSVCMSLWYVVLSYNLCRVEAVCLFSQVKGEVYPASRQCYAYGDPGMLYRYGMTIFASSLSMYSLLR